MPNTDHSSIPNTDDDDDASDVVVLILGSYRTEEVTEFGGRSPSRLCFIFTLLLFGIMRVVVTVDLNDNNNDDGFRCKGMRLWNQK